MAADEARIIGILSAFDESPSWLAGTVASMARICDHLVYIDGRYSLYDDPRNRSNMEQHEAILETARGCDLSLTFHSITRTWKDEMEKRSHAFKLAELEAEAFKDWYFILDADEILIDVPSSLKRDLKLIGDEGGAVCSAELYEVSDDQESEAKQKLGQMMSLDYTYSTVTPRFWRAFPGMRVDAYHYHYSARDNFDRPVMLWGQQQDGGRVYNELTGEFSHLLRWEHLAGVRIENRCLKRSKKRMEKRVEYYGLRDSVQSEKVTQYDGSVED